MFGLSLWEVGVATLVAFLIFGPEQFPVMIRQIMETIKKTKDFALQAQQTFSNLSSDLESTINDSLDPIKNNPWQDRPEQSSKGRDSGPEPELEPISLDTNVNNYRHLKIEWEKCAEMDLDTQNYHSGLYDWKNTT